MARCLALLGPGLDFMERVSGACSCCAGFCWGPRRGCYFAPLQRSPALVLGSLLILRCRVVKP
ncbi:MAG: hypothetical protein DU429_01130 [Candidatus Tokpelaia sp.]|nr:MAG: hypothetical protein DU430_02760 [Candidatus Tokpelaia sp.]KAA6207677.1 MAG: hypothetical protein DU429_01130 [Candidatus Tokpelaia sp.]